jgi:hypothetical protein
METATDNHPTAESEMHHPNSSNSFERIKSFNSRELMDYLTGERFFETFNTSQAKLRFQEAEVEGTLFIQSCWSWDFNHEKLHFVPGVSKRLTAVVKKIYMDACMSSVILFPLGVHY